MKAEYAVDTYEDRGPGGVVGVKRTVASREEALDAVRSQIPGWPVKAYERSVGEWRPLGEPGASAPKAVIVVLSLEGQIQQIIGPFESGQAAADHSATLEWGLPRMIMVLTPSREP